MGWEEDDNELMGLGKGPNELMVLEGGPRQTDSVGRKTMMNWWCWEEDHGEMTVL